MSWLSIFLRTHYTKQTYFSLILIINTSQSGNATDISSDGSNLSAAKTGDVAPIYLFIITLCISMTVLLVISTKKKKSVD